MFRHISESKFQAFEVQFDQITILLLHNKLFLALLLKWSKNLVLIN